MAQLREAYPSPRPHTISLAGLAGLVLGTLLGATPAAAQVAPSDNTEGASELCRVFAVAQAEGPVREGWQQLLANCAGRIYPLGRVTQFEIVANEPLGATLVDAWLSDERRVLLLSIQRDGSTLVENLTGQIARAAGRGPMSDIDRIGLDLEDFASTGALGLEVPLEERAAMRSESIDLAEQISRARADAAG